MSRKLGRKPRSFDPKVPHMSAMLGAMDLSPPPISVDWTKGITDFGMMLNDTLGDCTCAAVYHARQIWSLNASLEITELDSNVLALYEQATGYNPNDPNSDNGGIEQDVLKFLLNTGAPVGDGLRDKIIAFVEVDPRNVDDVKRCINDCGVAYIGFDVPSSLMPPDGNIASLWEVDHTNHNVEGGHAIILVGYDNIGPYLISWGRKYQMTWEFFLTYTDEAYAIADNAWFNATGKTPLDMDIATLEQLMHAIKE